MIAFIKRYLARKRYERELDKAMRKLHKSLQKSKNKFDMDKYFEKLAKECEA